MAVRRLTARTLVRRLQSPDSASSSAAAAELRLLSKHDPDSRAALADAGAVPLLASLLSDTSSAEDAAASLFNISISAPEALISTPGLLDALAAAIALAAPAAAASCAAATVYSLLSVDSHRPIVGSNDTLLRSLVALLATSPSARCAKDALKALFAIALHPPNRARLVALGAVPPLFAIIHREGRSGVVEDATAVAAQIAGCSEALGTFRGVSGVRTLVNIVGSEGDRVPTARARENAAAALLNLVTSGGDEAIADLRLDAPLWRAATLRLIESEDATARAKEKCAALLRAMNGGRSRSADDGSVSDS